MKSESLPDALADALGRVVAEVQREWRKDVDRFGAESRAIIAELRAEVVSLKAELRAGADEQAARVGEALAQVKDGEPGKNGKDADPDVIAQMVSDAVAAIPPPQDGKDADPEVIAGIVAAEVEKAVSGFPEPKDGIDGKDADPALIAEMVAEQVQKAVGEIELPSGPQGEPGRDGVGLAGAVIDRNGELVLTLTDGSTRALGVVVGRDGQPGLNGADGAPGRDGLGIENFDVTYDGERTVSLKWSGPDIVEERVFVLPVVLDRGVYSAGKEYERGDGVTFGGSYWIAQEPTTDKPETSKAWRLSAKRGRDGKDGIVKHEGPPKPVKVA